MSVDVKICGLKTAATVRAAIDAGADYVGLVFYGLSPRNVDVPQAAELADLARGHVKIVALFVDPDDSLLTSVSTQVRPDVIQLHGDETPERITEIRKLTSAAIMKAVKVANVQDVRAAERFAGFADMVLFDAKATSATARDGSAALPGGNGEQFDWRLLDAHDRSQPWMLSGGLDVSNVAEAVRQTGASAIDVSSGVERGKGEKDVALIAEFIRSAKSAAENNQGAQNRVEA